MIKQIQFNPEARELENFLKERDLYLPFDSADYIDPGDLVEVYSEDCVQIYRNSNLEKICSYDRQTLETQPFNVLFRREDKITEKLVARALQCISGQKSIEKINVEPHHMQENYAANSKVFYIEEKWCSPVFSIKTNNVMGFFATQSAKLVGDTNVIGIGNGYFSG